MAAGLQFYPLDIYQQLASFFIPHKYRTLIISIFTLTIKIYVLKVRSETNHLWSFEGLLFPKS